MVHSLVRKRFLKILVTLSILIALAVIIDWPVFRRVVTSVDWVLLIPLLLIQWVTRLAEALQLWLVIRFIGRSVSLSRVFLSNALATFYGFILPGHILATAPKWLVLSRATGSRADVLNAIIYNRLALLVPPIFIGSVAFGFTDIFLDNRLKYSLFLVGIGIVLATFLLFYRRTGAIVLGAMLWVTHRCPDGLRNAGSTFVGSFSRLQEFNVGKHLVVYALSTFVALLRIFAFIYAAWLVSADVPPESLALAYAVIVVLALFPLTLGNIGIRESVLISVLSLYGVAPAESLTIGLILFLEHVLFAVVGGGFQLRLASERSGSA